MKNLFTCILLFPFLVTIIPGKTGANMKHIEDGQFRIYYSGNSGEIAERLMHITKKSYPILKGRGASERIKQTGNPHGSK
jgi:hypothetical protein